MATKSPTVQHPLQISLPRNRVSKDRAGQAMIELIVGIVAILALFAGLLQLVEISAAHTDAMTEARSRVGLMAISDENPPTADEVFYRMGVEIVE